MDPKKITEAFEKFSPIYEDADRYTGKKKQNQILTFFIVIVLILAGFDVIAFATIKALKEPSLGRHIIIFINFLLIAAFPIVLYIHDYLTSKKITCSFKSDAIISFVPLAVYAIENEHTHLDKNTLAKWIEKINATKTIPQDKLMALNYIKACLCASADIKIKRVLGADITD